jgi:hypothetical protein
MKEVTIKFFYFVISKKNEFMRKNQKVETKDEVLRPFLKKASDVIENKIPIIVKMVTNGF